MMKSLLRLGWQVCVCLHCKIMLCCQQHLACVCVTIQAFSLPLCAFPCLCPRGVSLFPTGRITLSNWATAVESVLRLGLPWRMLRPQLVRSTEDGILEYKSWLDDLAMEQRSQEVSTYSLPSKHDVSSCSPDPQQIIVQINYGTKGQWMVSCKIQKHRKS